MMFASVLYVLVAVMVLSFGAAWWLTNDDVKPLVIMAGIIVFFAVPVVMYAYLL